MALRKVIAERVSGLKKRLPTETPIIQEIPVTAKTLSSALFTLPAVGGIIPSIARGKAYGDIAGLWYRVTFPKPLNNPSVVVVGEGRGEVLPTPSAGVPAIANITIPSARSGHVPTSLGRFTCGWAIASLTDGLNDLMTTLEGVLGRINQVVDDLYSGLEEARASLTSLDAKVNDLRSKVNDTFASIIPSLYNAWGIPTSMALTPLHIRNVTSTGFEFQSYGKTTCYYIGIGSLRS